MQVESLYDKALDWLWMVAIAVATVVGRAFVRIWRHEERIKALEAARSNEAKALSDLAKVVYENHESTREQLTDAMSEIRADLRIIMSKVID